MEFPTWINEKLNMPTLPEMRDLAQRLLVYEANAGETPELVESTILGLYEKLRQALSGLAGVAGFQSLASRALALARTEVPSLSAVRIAADGALLGLDQGLGESEQQIDNGNDDAGEFPAGEGAIILIARSLGLLRILLGDALTLSLLQVTWPDAAFDDRNSENRRKA